MIDIPFDSYKRLDYEHEERWWRSMGFLLSYEESESKGQSEGKNDDGSSRDERLHFAGCNGRFDLDRIKWNESSNETNKFIKETVHGILLGRPNAKDAKQEYPFFIKNNLLERHHNSWLEDHIPLDSIEEIRTQDDFLITEETFRKLEVYSHIENRESNEGDVGINLSMIRDTPVQDEGLDWTFIEENKSILKEILSIPIDPEQSGYGDINNNKNTFESLEDIEIAKKQRSNNPISLLRKHFSIKYNNVVLKVVGLYGNKITDKSESDYVNAERRRVAHMPPLDDDFNLHKDDYDKPIFILPDKKYGPGFSDMYNPIMWTAADFKNCLPPLLKEDKYRSKRIVEKEIADAMELERTVVKNHFNATGIMPKRDASDKSKHHERYNNILSNKNGIDGNVYIKPKGRFSFWRSSSKMALTMIVELLKNHRSDARECKLRENTVDMLESWKTYVKENKHSTCLDFVLCSFSRSHMFLYGVYEQCTVKNGEVTTSEVVEPGRRRNRRLPGEDKPVEVRYYESERVLRYEDRDFPVKEYAIGDNYDEVTNIFKIPLPEFIVNDINYAGLNALVHRGYSVLATCLWRVLNLHRLQVDARNVSNPWLYHQLQLLIDSHLPLMGAMLKFNTWSDQELLEDVEVSYFDTNSYDKNPSFEKSVHPTSPSNVFKSYVDDQEEYDPHKSLMEKTKKQEKSNREKAKRKKNKDILSELNLFEDGNENGGDDNTEEDNIVDADDPAGYDVDENGRQIIYPRTERIHSPLFTFWPLSTNVCTFEELPDITPATNTDFWYEITQKRESGRIDKAFSHLLFEKLLYMRCSARNFMDIAQSYFVMYPALFNYFQLCIQTSRLGNYPGIMCRPSFVMRLRNHISFRYECMTLNQWMHYMDRHKHTVQLCLRRQVLETIQLVPAVDNLLRSKQTYPKWRATTKYAHDIYLRRYDNLPLNDYHKLHNSSLLEKYTCSATPMDVIVIPYTYSIRKIAKGKEDAEKYGKRNPDFITDFDVYEMETEIMIKAIHKESSKEKLRKGRFEDAILKPMRGTYLVIHKIENTKSSERRRKEELEKELIDEMENEAIAAGNIAEMTPEDREKRKTAILRKLRKEFEKNQSRRVKDAISYGESKTIMENVVNNKPAGYNETMMKTITYHIARTWKRWIPAFILQYFMVEQEAIQLFKILVLYYEKYEMPDNWFKEPLSALFDRYPQSFSVIKDYLEGIQYYRQDPLILLPRDQARRQMMALRYTSYVGLFQQTPKDLGVCYFCEKCRRWANTIIKSPEYSYEFEYEYDLLDYKIGCVCLADAKAANMGQNRPTFEGDVIRLGKDLVQPRRISTNGVVYKENKPNQDTLEKIKNCPTLKTVSHYRVVKTDTGRNCSTHIKHGAYNLLTKEMCCAHPVSKRRIMQNHGIFMKSNSSVAVFEKTHIETLLDDYELVNDKPKYGISQLLKFAREKRKNYTKKKGRLIVTEGSDPVDATEINDENADNIREYARIANSILGGGSGSQRGKPKKRGKAPTTRGNNSLNASSEEIMGNGSQDDDYHTSEVDNDNDDDGFEDFDDDAENDAYSDDGNDDDDDDDEVEVDEDADNDLNEEEEVERKVDEDLYGIMNTIASGKYLKENDVVTLSYGITNMFDNNRYKGTKSKPATSLGDLDEMEVDQAEWEDGDYQGDDDDETNTGDLLTVESNDLKKHPIDKFKKNLLNVNLLLSSSSPHTVNRKCNSPLTAINMVGCVKKDRDKYYGLCVFCGSLTHIRFSRMTNFGPSCGNHGMIDRTPTFYITEMAQFNKLSLKWKNRRCFFTERSLHLNNTVSYQDRVYMNLVETFLGEDGHTFMGATVKVPTRQGYTPGNRPKREFTLYKYEIRPSINSPMNPSIIDYTTMMCDYCHCFFNHLEKVLVKSSDGINVEVLKLCDFDYRGQVSKLVRSNIIQDKATIFYAIFNKRKRQSAARFK